MTERRSEQIERALTRREHHELMSDIAVSNMKESERRAYDPAYADPASPEYRDRCLGVAGFHDYDPRDYE